MSDPSAGSAPANVLDLFRLDGRAALVTGASSGLGAGFALALAEAGADVALVARRREGLEKTAAGVRERGRRALVVPADVTDADACGAAVAAAVDEFGRLDALVNNAGITSVTPALRELPGDFQRVLDVNLTAAYLMATACAREMGRGSSIVNVSSVLGLVKSVLPRAAYAASKAGLIGLTRDLAHQWSERRGIRVKRARSRLRRDRDERGARAGDAGPVPRDGLAPAPRHPA
ncbi:SDR family NAD(P)-dependent oxidoreductase [Actinomadura physcomitrii]|uniref:SDR family NAD(P)-dependent oxidoreductase n=1 Tax=Actinomadura physcomitrii TaxID=2650748 RepID=UPI001920C769|nr:SDR family oxidoreductase [Actinomadura physcomitrii]